MGGEKGTQFGVRKIEFHSKYRFFFFWVRGGLAALSHIGLMLSHLCAVHPTFEKTSGQTLSDVFFFLQSCDKIISTADPCTSFPPGVLLLELRR